MSDEPVVWHYGLMAERWGEYIHDAPEAAYFTKMIDRFGQPALDLGCGAGRLLLPLLEASIDIDGCDISGDMLVYCQNRARAEGYRPTLYESPMNEIDLPRRYRTIYICDSFGLAGSREKDLETLRRCYEHLHDGGALLLNIQAEYTDRESWNDWLSDRRATLPEPWPEEGSVRTGADGSENTAYFRFVDLNPLEQTYTREVRLEKRIDGRLAASQKYTLKGNMYLKSEVLLLLQAAGFSEIGVYGDYSDETATPESEEINFVAVKQAREA